MHFLNFLLLLYPLAFVEASTVNNTFANNSTFTPAANLTTRSPSIVISKASIPSSTPESAPTMVPTNVKSTNRQKQTSLPTMLSETHSPTESRTSLNIYYSISVAAMADKTSFIESYKVDLTRAMNILARQVSIETNADSRRYLRSLSIDVVGPTSITNLASFPCIACTSVNSSANLCQNVTHQIIVTQGNNATELAVYQDNLHLAILEGRLEMQVEATNPSASVSILNASSIGTSCTPVVSSGRKYLSIGAIAGIVLAVLFVMTVAVSSAIYLTTEEDGAPISKDDIEEPLKS